MNNLANIPNQRDFKFVGVRKDGTQARCRVTINPLKQICVVSGLDYDVFWDELAGWLPVDDWDAFKECRTCVDYGRQIAPSHCGLDRCQSGSLASGGTRAHCSCDVCF